MRRALSLKKQPANFLTPDAGLQIVWITIAMVCEKTGWSRSTAWRITTDKRNRIRTLLVRSHPDSQSGQRRVHLPDLVAFFERQAAESEEARANLEGALK